MVVVPSPLFDAAGEIDPLLEPRVALPFTTRALPVRPERRIAVEHCPRISITGLDAAGVFATARGSQKFLDIPNRIEAVMQAEPVGDHFLLHLGYRILVTDQTVNRDLWLVPSRTRRARHSWRFVCPGTPNPDGSQEPCGQRVLTIYFPDLPEAPFPACRACHGLTYLARQSRAHRGLTGRTHRPPPRTPFTPLTPADGCPPTLPA